MIDPEDKDPIERWQDVILAIALAIALAVFVSCVGIAMVVYALGKVGFFQ